MPDNEVPSLPEASPTPALNLPALKPGAESSEFQAIVKPTAYAGLGLVILGVVSLAIPPLAPISATAISTGLTMLGGSGASYLGTRTLLKGIELVKK